MYIICYNMHRVNSVKNTLKSINTVQSAGKKHTSISLATRNQNKLLEFKRILGIDVVGKDLKVPEIQESDPLKVLEQKAIDAWKANNYEPIIVEDSALTFVAFTDFPGTFADNATNTADKREGLCRMLDGKERNAVFQVGIAFYDGIRAQTRIAQVTGMISESPRGSNGFGFDDIFIPDGQNKTYAEMTSSEKDQFSPRRIALEKLAKEPFRTQRNIRQIPDPFPLQIEALRIEKFTNKKVLRYVYNLECLEGVSPQADLSVANRNPYIEKSYAKGQIKQLLPTKHSASLGIILTPWDTATDLHDNPMRLKVDTSGNPIFWQMGDESVKLALAARAAEFLFYHNEEMYAYIRSLQRGDVVIAPRANKRSHAIERLLQIMKRQSLNRDNMSSFVEEMDILGTATISELGYARMFSERKMSRSASIQKGLLLNATGIPSSIFCLGGMPPTTGWRDVLVTSALSFMRSYIPRNSIYAGNLALQITLFEKAREEICRLELPHDITEIIIKQIGIAVGCEDPEKVAREARKIQQAGCSSIRFYSTNPDRRLVDSVEAVRQKVGRDMNICVAPIVDVRQAQKLIGNNISVNMLLAGHGGGENCTSLEGGGAANSLELLYQMYLNDAFNKTAIGLEGGTGNAIGAILGMLDVISLNKRGVNGGIEAGGLFVEHINGRVCQPYHGSASPITQWIESALNQEIAQKRLNDAGKLRNVEGKANYMYKPRSVNSIVDNFQEARMYAARALADQDATSISELRENIKKYGHINHRIVSNAAAYVASAHREVK